MAPKGQGSKKGSKQLCSGLSTIADANLEIAADQLNAGDTKGANESMAIVEAAQADMKKWGCSGTAKSARARQRAVALRKEIARAGRSGRSRPTR
jgi:hypothetical protein